jgi:hypothetical protein
LRSPSRCAGSRWRKPDSPRRSIGRHCRYLLRRLHSHYALASELFYWASSSAAARHISRAVASAGTCAAVTNPSFSNGACACGEAAWCEKDLGIFLAEIVEPVLVCAADRFGEQRVHVRHRHVAAFDIYCSNSKNSATTLANASGLS